MSKKRPLSGLFDFFSDNFFNLWYYLIKILKGGFPMRGLVWRWIVNGLALFLTAQILPKISIDSPGSAFIAALVLGLANAVIRPIIKIITFPITIVTLGLFTFIINGFILWVVQNNVTGFTINGFWAAVLGAIVLSIISSVLTNLITDQN